MAKCEKREIKVQPPPAEYVLTLTEDEASFLAELSQMVSSNGFSFSITEPLRDAGAPRDRWRIVTGSNGKAVVTRV